MEARAEAGEMAWTFTAEEAERIKAILAKKRVSNSALLDLRCLGKEGADWDDYWELLGTYEHEKPSRRLDLLRRVLRPYVD